MNRLLLVDGSNLLFQMFYGMPSRIVNEQGRAIHGTLGFVGALLKMIRMTKPTHIAVLFDGEHPNERTAISADYKANRPDYSQLPEKETPFSQLPDIYAALNYLNISHAETTVCEADDWMAGYAMRYGQENEIILSSFDSDFFQLITEHVSVLRYRGEKTVLYTPDTIQEKFGICPAQYADYKALTGDAADNIKGAEKVGPKTASALLNQFGTLELLLSNADQIAKPSVRRSILDDAERLRLNERLIRLSGSAPVPFPLETLEYDGFSPTTTEVLKAIHLRL